MKAFQWIPLSKIIMILQREIKKLEKREKKKKRDS